MAEAATIARPYARAAFDAAQARAAIPKWSEWLSAAGRVVLDERVATLTGNPRVRSAELVSFILDLSGAAGDDSARNFLQLLADNRRLALLPEVSSQFAALRAQFENTLDVTVTSAFPLTEAQSSKLSAALTQRLQRTVRLHAAVDPALIGGAVVQAGDFVFDGSLQGRVTRLGGAMGAG